MAIFEEAVEEDDEFAYDGGEGDLDGFAAVAQAKIKRLQDRVVPSGDERGQIEHAAHGDPPAVDVALPAALAAVAVERCDADERRRLRVADAAQFGHERERRERTPAPRRV